jgi:predicted ATP-binding protein involved in virulence
MSLVREAFPNLQLLTTTHSPLVVADADANEADVVLLREVEDRVEAVSDVSSTRGLRADQVLATEIFGYLIDRDPKTEERMRRASILAGKDYRSAEEESEYHSLIQLVKAVVAEGQTNFERKIASEMESELLDRASRLEDKLFGKEQP